MKKLESAVLVSALSTLIFASAAMAQFAPGGPPAPGTPPGQRGGGFAGRLPFTMGAVTAVNASAGTVTITPRFGGDTQTISVAAGTQVSAQVEATIDDLKVGDTVQVAGVPTAITAKELTIGQMPSIFPGGGGPGGRGAVSAASAGSVFDKGDGTPPYQAIATVSARVLQKDPLTLSLGNGVEIVLKIASNAKITKVSALPLSSLKVGDQVAASGQAGDDGSFGATSLMLVPKNGGANGFGGFGGGRFGGGGRRGGANGSAPAAPGGN